MRKLILVLMAAFCVVPPLMAAGIKVSYNEEMYSLGTVSGQGLACKSQKYHKFEMLARAIMVGKAANTKQQKEGMQNYSAGKADAFMALEGANFANCPQILKEFDNQKIFQSVLYSDGKVKMYDGTVITPRKPYDASKLYVKDREAFIKADQAYKKSLAKATKNAQNAKKVPLIDSNYKNYADEFGK